MTKAKYLFALMLLPCALCAQASYFPPTNSFNWDTISLEEAGFCADNEQALYDYLEETNTDAFLLLKDGKIVMEQYFGNFTRFSSHLWNSAGKSLMAFTAGIAVGLDSLNVEDPVADYLGTGWTNCPETEAAIRVIHQLTMTSGLSDQTIELFCTDPECLVCLATPGERWAYHNGPYTLLGEVIESAVEQDLNDFIDDRIQALTGITGSFSYLGDNRIYLSNARAMARFGLLVANEGTWDGTPVINDPEYFRAMINSSQDINPSYGYLWWLNGKDNYRLPSLQTDFPGPIMTEAPAETIAAIGKNGQIINVVPSQGLVMVRMGGSPSDDSLVPTFYNDSIWSRINALSCTTTIENRVDVSTLRVFPNPAAEEIRVSATKAMLRGAIYNYAGDLLREAPVTGATDASISLAGLPAGLLLVRIGFADGSYRWERVVRQ
ncbi:serine hydrolase [Neolewinella aurantiaca]|uniref:Serine hydrolase n=1 Tax=Neolewinella aurantiaca TaxID=2602767 RepID=A0A5C7FB67_9BACT|nr:serine hydrolase [Neolewinella aurantiaca]TXF88069.1 serine hydrolase [Neolewinella aurantiaca]